MAACRVSEPFVAEVPTGVEPNDRLTGDGNNTTGGGENSADGADSIRAGGGLDLKLAHQPHQCTVTVPHARVEDSSTEH
jgi:hypothetical protein